MEFSEIDIPYYIVDDDGVVKSIKTPNEAYIDDDDLKNLLYDFLGDEIPEEDIEKILNAASDKNLSEEDFDKIVDEFILKNKSSN